MNHESAAARDVTAVPFTDLSAMAGEVWPEIEQEYLACLLDGAYIGGPAVTAFERRVGRLLRRGPCRRPRERNRRPGAQPDRARRGRRR